MTVDEALAEPGRKLVAARPDKNDNRVVTIYGLAAGGAKLLAAVDVPAAELDATLASLTARGCELAHTEAQTNIVWVTSGNHIEVWDKRRKQLDASGDRATNADDEVIARSEVAQVITWADEDDYATRGIKAVLKSGGEAELVTEISLAATGDPTYNRNDLLFDSGWCTTLGRVLATWAGAPFENRI